MTLFYGNTRSIVSMGQHGFITGRSTVTNFARVFDIIPHDILLLKHSGFGISYTLLKVIESYLTNGKSNVFYMVAHLFFSP